MISIYKLKPQFQKLLTPILEALHRKNITANQITWSACILSCIIAILFSLAQYSHFLFLALPIGLFIRMALNALDGMMAKRYNQMSKKGELLNEVGDIVSDFIIFLPLLKFFPQSVYAIAMFIGLSIVNEFVGVMGKLLTGDRRYDGPMGKSDRAFIIGLYGLLCFLGVSIIEYADTIFGVINALLITSTFVRLRKTWRQL